MALLVNPVLAAVASGGPGNPAFVQSVNEIQAYSEFMANVQLTGYGDVDAALTTAKTNAATWYNTIYPTYLNMPETISSQAPAVDSSLTVLVQLAGQYQSTPTDQIRQAINDQAKVLQTPVENILSQTQALATDLQTFSHNLQSDASALTNARGSLESDAQDLCQQLANLNGQLYQLQNATCPSQSDINACKQTIETKGQQFQATESQYEVFLNAASNAVNAGSGLLYLTGYWTTVAQDAQQCINALTRLQNDAGAVLQLDLRNTQSLWNELKAEFQGLVTRMAAL